MSAAGSKVNHSVVFSAVLCCRSLPLLVLLPLPPPLACSGFWWAAMNRNRQLIAKADLFFFFFEWGKESYNLQWGKFVNSHWGWQWAHWTLPDSDDGGQCPVSLPAGLRVRGQAVLHVSKNTSREKANTAFEQRSIYDCAPPHPPIPMYPQPSMETVCFHC